MIQGAIHAQTDAKAKLNPLNPLGGYENDSEPATSSDPSTENSEVVEGVADEIVE